MYTYYFQDKTKYHTLKEKAEKSVLFVKVDNRECKLQAKL